MTPDDQLNDLVERLKQEGYPARRPVTPDLKEVTLALLVPFMAYAMDRLEASA